MSRRRKLLWICAVLLALALIPIIAHYRAKAAAEKFKAQLRARGEKLSIDELIPLPPLDAPNGASAVLNAVSRLTSYDYELQPGVMKMLQPGHARITWQQATLPTDRSEDIWPALREHLETNRVALAELREALRQPVLQFQVNYHLGFYAQLPHLAQVKSASQRLSAAAIMAMHDQRTDEAFANLQALVALPARYRESYLISQLVRCALVAIAASATWEALQYPHWSEEQLATLQAAWESMRTIPQMERALAMDRAFIIEEFAKARESLDRLNNISAGGKALDDLAEVGNKIIENPSEGFEELMDRFPRRWVWKWWNCYDDEIWYLRSLQLSIDVCRAVTNGQPFLPLTDKVQADTKRVGETPRQFLLSRVLGAESYSKSIDRAIVAETHRRVAVTAIALKRFERRTGKLPRDLAELVPALLSSAPLDPMDGQSLRYLLSGTNSFLLYSIGLDGVDGNGDTAPKELNSKLFSSWLYCKDWVWAQPATAAQLREFNAQLEQKRARTSPRIRK